MSLFDSCIPCKGTGQSRYFAGICEACHGTKISKWCKKYLDYKTWYALNEDLLEEEYECDFCDGSGSIDCKNKDEDLCGVCVLECAWKCPRCNGYGAINSPAEQYDRQLKTDKEKVRNA